MSLPTQLAITLNRMIVATTASYRQDGAWAAATMLAEDGLRDRPNDVRLFTIEPRRGRTALRPVASLR